MLCEPLYFFFLLSPLYFLIMISQSLAQKLGLQFFMVSESAFQILEIREAVEEAADSQALNQIKSQV